jgi:hypothetical protein
VAPKAASAPRYSLKAPRTAIKVDRNEHQRHSWCLLSSDKLTPTGRTPAVVVGRSSSIRYVSKDVERPATTPSSQRPSRLWRPESLPACQLCQQCFRLKLSAAVTFHTPSAGHACALRPATRSSHRLIHNSLSAAPTAAQHVPNHYQCGFESICPPTGAAISASD